jgi:MSHA pilin protein MshA
MRITGFIYKGFTLIELITVILILGILAAIAAPKFINLTGQARVAALNGLRASVSSAATLANAVSVAQSLGSSTSVTVEGTAVTMAANYPSGAAGGIDVAVRFDTAAYATTSAASPQTFVVKTAPTTAGCSFTYTSATASSVPPVISVATTTGC